MAPFLAFALALLASDAAPVATSEPAATPAPPAQAMGASPVAPPEDDYGYVAWCYGAISAYVELYDKAMPDVIRIERAWPTPSTEENINEVYPGQKKESIAELKLFVRAMTAAEKASAKPIQPYGAAAIKRGRAVWQGADTVTPAQLAQFWMSWSPPAKCEDTARSLEKKAKLMGQALTYNVPEAEAAPPADAAAAPPASDAPAADAAASDVMSGLANPAMTEAPGPDAPAPETPPTDATPAPEAEPEAAPAADAPAADAEKAPEADPAQPSLPQSIEPKVEVVTEPATPDDPTGVPEAIAPTPKGDTASATGFKPRKKKPDLRGPQ